MLLKEGKGIGDFFCGEFLSFCKKYFENNFQKINRFSQLPTTVKCAEKVLKMFILSYF
jgi:hypothetical protein